VPLDPLARDHFDPERVEAIAEVAARSPVPARIGNILIGSCSWTDPTLVKSGLWYPPSANNAEKRLRFYASQFPVVEVDSSYYALPTAANAERWVARTPDDFVFDVKAFGSLTGHDVDLRRLPKALKEVTPPDLLRKGRVRASKLPPSLHRAMDRWFVEALEPLRVAGKLGCVLLQFPPWMVASDHNVRAIAECRDRLGALPLAVEFRHQSWVAPDRVDRTLDLLRNHGMSWVCVDAPDGPKNAMPMVVEVTNPALAVVRFHGRNRFTWNKRVGTAAERFDHLYSAAELTEWVEPIQELADQAQQVHGLMNNCTYNAAQLSGYGLAALIAEAATR